MIIKYSELNGFCLNMEVCRNSLTCLIIITVLVYATGQSAGRNACRNSQKIPCDNGECILRNQWCDKELDCGDGSDEEYCKTTGWFGSPNHDCTDKHFICADEHCIPVDAKCDGHNDCWDNSDEDEVSCGKTTAPAPPNQTETQHRGGSYARQSTITTTTTMQPRIDHHVTRPPTDTDHYDRRIDESDYQSRHRPNPSSPQYPRQDNYGQDQNNYDYTHSNNYRGSDTRPTHRFPHYQHPSPPIPYPSPEPPVRPQSSIPDNRRQNPHTRHHDRYPAREQLMTIQPRSVLYPLQSSPSYYRRSKTQYPPFRPFQFTENCTQHTEQHYKYHVKKAKDWLLERRDDSYSWGRDTPRGMIALSLITNSFTTDITDNELMQKGLQTHLGFKLLRNNTRVEKMSTTRLAMYINALLATCQDPRDFLGLDLTNTLYHRKRDLAQYQVFVNPLIHLALCLTDKAVDPDEMSGLESFLVLSFPNDISKDIHILALTALSCFLQKDLRNDYLRQKVNEGYHSLMGQMFDDGSFGSVYTTALAAQALMAVSSVDPGVSWNPRLTLDYLAHNQSEDGSFGDMQATYYAVIALSGRSLLHLRNTHCDPPATEGPQSIPDLINPPEGTPMKRVFCLLKVGVPETTFSTAIQVTVPDRTDGFDIMRVAAHFQPQFQFSYKITKDLLGIHTIANIPNDPERGTFWNLYYLRGSDNSPVDLRRRYYYDIRTLIPQDGDTLLYWYFQQL